MAAPVLAFAPARAEGAQGAEGAEQDTTRVRRVVAEQYGTIWRFLRRMGVAESLAEDGAQQVFVVFARRLPDIAPEAERRFLFGTARRIAADFRKRQERTPELVDVDAAFGSLPSEVAMGAGIDAALDERKARRMLDDILRALPAELSEVLVLCDIDELTMAETAATLDLAPGTVASRLRRARQIFDGKVNALRLQLASDARVHSAHGEGLRR